MEAGVAVPIVVAVSVAEAAAAVVVAPAVALKCREFRVAVATCFRSPAIATARATVLVSEG